MHNIRVLLVDDEKKFVVSIKKFLTNRQFEVETAHTGQEALDILNSDPGIHVVVLDVRMPGMDGFSVLREIKARFPLMEVVMLTGNASMDSAVSGIKMGASDFLMKPADPRELVQKIREAAEKRGFQEEKNRYDQKKQGLTEESGGDR